MAQHVMGGGDTRFLRDEIHQLESHLELKEREVTQLEKEMGKERKANEEVALFTSALHPVQMAQHVMGGGDTRFLRDEIHQLESHLELKEREVTQLEKEMGKERKANEELALCAEEAEEKNRKLKREVCPVISHAEGMAANLKSENEHLQKNLEESVKEMENMIAVQQTDAIMDQLRKERDHAKLQIRELNEQIQARVEEDDPVMAAVNAKVEEWKSVLSGKDMDILKNQQMIRDLREKLQAAQMDSDKSNIIALQQAVQERDNQIKMLSEQVEQYTTEMEKNAVLIEELKKPLKKDKGHVSVQQRRLEDLSTKLQAGERRALEAERAAQLAEHDARDKDKELSDTLSRIRLYESVSLSLFFLLHLYCEHSLKIFPFMGRMVWKRPSLRSPGLNQKEELDLSEFRRSKILKQRQYKAKNQVLLKEVKPISVVSVTNNKQLEQGMKEILRAIQDTQKKTPTSTGVSIPSLDRLNNALEMKYSEGKFDLTGRNEELRQEMKAAREEAANTLNQLTKANEKIARLESEVESVGKSTGTAIHYKSLALPEEMTPTSAEVINTLNEYMVQLLQVCVSVRLLYHIITETRCNVHNIKTPDCGCSGDQKQRRFH
uniref:Centrosomal protein of 290kDa coiled-coil region domain-containing protein n=1 Tax=Sinocyclocheilus grahami TaxID=75366 RepID=A0A672SJD6_SINGR